MLVISLVAWALAACLGSCLASSSSSLVSPCPRPWTGRARRVSGRTSTRSAAYIPCALITTYETLQVICTRRYATDHARLHPGS